MRRLGVIGLLYAAIAVGCGNADPVDFNVAVATQLPPVVSRLSTTTGAIGHSVSIFGYGFSTTAQDNIILMAGTSTVASVYALVDPAIDGELEQLRFSVPAGASSGATTVYVSVFGNVSNTNTTFTVTP